MFCLERSLTHTIQKLAAPSDFHDLVVEKVNDAERKPFTIANAELHSTFTEAFECPKREHFTFTREKSKHLLLDFKHRLNEICKRYDQSGNGSNQLDEDGEEVEKADERAFGRVCLELARQKGGDNRSNFLKHDPVDLLYYWDVMDRHDLIHFTTAQLRGPNAVSSESRPALTSYGSRGESSEDDNSPNRNGGRPSKRSKNGGNEISLEMARNVSIVGSAMSEMTQQDWFIELNRLKKELKETKNEWRKEKRSTHYQPDEDDDYYKDTIASI